MFLYSHLCRIIRSFCNIDRSVMMDFRLYTSLPKNAFSLTHRDKIMVMGSCFSEHIGQKLQASKFDCVVNPSGVLYNPFSIARALENSLSGRASVRLFHQDGLWRSWDYDTSFASPDKDTLRRSMAEAALRAGEFWKNPGLLILSFGTNHYYRVRNDSPFYAQAGEEAVANCHKVPGRNFEERVGGVEEMVCRWTELFSRMWQEYPALKVLCTVSPVRYKKYGLHGSALSKAALLLMVDELVRAFPGRCFYFPSYEIVTDELRDYRFYAEDMVHPSAQAVEYVWECFDQSFFTDDTRMIIKEYTAIRKALAHRPLHPETDVYQCFLHEIMLRIEAFQRKYPYLSLPKEQNLCHTLLNQ